MDSFELNKILGAILGTCLGVLSINIAAGAIFAPGKLAKPGYEIAVPEQAPSGGSQTRGRRSSSRSSSCSPRPKSAAGRNAAKKCAACHTFNKGGRPLVGPNLWGVVGRPKASEAGIQLFGRAEGERRELDDR